MTYSEICIAAAREIENSPLPLAVTFALGRVSRNDDIKNAVFKDYAQGFLCDGLDQATNDTRILALCFLATIGRGFYD